MLRRCGAAKSRDGFRDHYGFRDHHADFDEVDKSLPHLVACAVEPANQFHPVTQLRHRPRQDVVGIHVAVDAAAGDAMPAEWMRQVDTFHLPAQAAPTNVMTDVLVIQLPAGAASAFVARVEILAPIQNQIPARSTIGTDGVAPIHRRREVVNDVVKLIPVVGVQDVIRLAVLFSGQAKMPYLDPLA